MAQTEDFFQAFVCAVEKQRNFEQNRCHPQRQCKPVPTSACTCAGRKHAQFAHGRVKVLGKTSVKRNKHDVGQNRYHRACHEYADDRSEQPFAHSHLVKHKIHKQVIAEPVPLPQRGNQNVVPTRLGNGQQPRPVRTDKRICHHRKHTQRDRHKQQLTYPCNGRKAPCKRKHRHRRNRQRKQHPIGVDVKRYGKHFVAGTKQHNHARSEHKKKYAHYYFAYNLAEGHVQHKVDWQASRTIDPHCPQQKAQANAVGNKPYAQHKPTVVPHVACQYARQPQKLATRNYQHQHKRKLTDGNSFLVHCQPLLVLLALGMLSGRCSCCGTGL